MLKEKKKKKELTRIFTKMCVKEILVLCPE